MRFAKFWLPVIIWAIVIFAFSNFPTVQTTEFYLADFLLKKTAHLVEYAILAILLYRALINSNVDKKKALIIAIVISAIYGLSDEFHQFFTPGRGPSIRDVVIDTIGGGIGSIWAKKYL